MPPSSSHMHASSSSPAPWSVGGDGHNGVPSPQVALVHDWLPVYAGAERVLEQMIATLSDASLYTLIDCIPDDQRDFLQGVSVETSCLQRLPWIQHIYRYCVPFAPLAIEQFDLRSYDVVVSSSYAVAKGALTRADQLHISYVHSPIRYAWDLYPEHINTLWGPRRWIAQLILHYLRLYDATTASRPDVFVANSKHVARRIWKTYRRRAQVIYPPVDVDRFTVTPDKEAYYLTMSRLVPYKRIDLVIDAFNAMPDKELIVIGDGPERDALAQQAGPNVSLLGYQPDDAVEYYLQHARAFVFAAEEDFGILPVEAQACGTPVIAYGRGGATETVRPGETGLFFYEQTAEALQSAIGSFESLHDRFEPEVMRTNAERFSPDRFRDEFQRLLIQSYEDFQQGTPWLNDTAVPISPPAASSA